MDECEKLRASILARKIKQNERRAKAGKPPMWPALLKPPKKKRARRAGKKGALPPPDSGDEDDSALSFDEWKEAGYAVRKGERSRLTDIHGTPQFTRLQVRRINPAWEKYRQRKS